MGMTWTEEQKKVITLRDRNILVSAAAGSGKTAVLVERILSRITDAEKPVDIDRLLIMTFTRAAAGEMRERISAALEDALYQDPDNEHLQRQMTLVHTAQITTIDGFCSYIIRNFFHLIGLDPGYRTADEGELRLLKEDVLKELLEDCYQEKSEDFYEFVECYASGKTDEGIGEFIFDVYDAAMSHPDPEKWLMECLDVYRADNLEDLQRQPWMELLWETAAEDLQEAESLLKSGIEICGESDGPCLYEEALASDLLFLRTLKEAAGEKDYDRMSGLLGNPAFARLSSKKMPDADPMKKDQVKNLREEAKNILKEMGSRYFIGTGEQLLNMMQLCRVPMESLVKIVLSFMERFRAKKREQNLLDFTDMEHFALDILITQDEEGNKVPSQAAWELSEKYEEVLVDEYQDSNLVQELLTTMVSGWVNDRKNIFMVGDVKQSIYRFRLARPELFMEKYKHYSQEDSPEQRIDLHKNFRSRCEVLDSVNFIFRQIMGEDLGGIIYDDAAALYPGAAFPERENEDFCRTEVLLVEKDGEELAEEQDGKNARELEALAVAQKILDIVGKEEVLDKESGTYRKAEYGDIVILLRTAYGWAETFSEVLSSKGIPSYTTSRTGYFSAREVVTVLNYLKVCDNPLQDIPLAAVLRSPIVGCTSQELAQIRSEYPSGLLYDSVRAFADNGQLVLFPEEDGRENLKKKLRSFLEQLEEIREMASYTPVHQLILYVLKATGYGNYARALPGGEQRSANLHMLVERAMEYEKTSYRGLFHFIRYIENLHKYEVDFGEVNLSAVSSVKIMTIHKSKGLEFPIVIAAGMGKQFNFQDVNARLLIHPDLGFGADAILPKERVVITTLYKQMIRRTLLKECLGEELRVLYVAMTRAREKLILTGTIGKMEKQMENLARYQNREEMLLPVGMRLKAKNYWSYILPALAGHRCMDELYQEYGLFGKPRNEWYHAEAEFEVRKITAADLAGGEVLYQAEDQIREELIKGWDGETVYDPEIRKTLEERFCFSYPFGYLEKLPVKVSVSELKKKSYTDDSDREESLYFEPDVVPLIPRFIAGEEENVTGAARGTAYHKLMECLDYRFVSSEEEIGDQIRKLLNSGKMSEPEALCIDLQDVLKFTSSSLGERMQEASLKGRLFREQPFVLSCPASELNPEWDGGETILVQGIIDAFFLEEGEIVLVDYKTDQVKEGEEQRLVSLYHIQLEEYAAALSRLLEKPVKEIYIYSFTLNKEIPLTGEF